MKKNILYILIAFLFTAIACNEKDDVETYDLGTEFLISSSGFTSLDNQVTLTIDNQQKNLSGLDISQIAKYNDDGDEVSLTSAYTGTMVL